VRKSVVVLAAAGAGLAILSAVPAWLVHRRVLMGEGSRLVVSEWNAWQQDSLPVVTAGVLLALLVAILGVARSLRWPRIPGWLLVLAAAGSLGLLLGAAWPLEQRIGGSSIGLSAGLALVAGIVLVTVVVVGAIASAHRSRPVLLGMVAVLVLGLAGGIGGRALGLTLRKAAVDGRGGVYARAAADGGPATTLTMRDGAYAVDNRWSGTFVRSGITIVLLDDPACPDTRGSYHALPADGDRSGDRIRLDAILDLCAGGERAADLEAGVWVRQE
jgi:hypothetical protein